MIKLQERVGLVGVYLNIIKAFYNKPTANIMLNGEKQNESDKIKNETQKSIIPIPFQYSTGGIS